MTVIRINGSATGNQPQGSDVNADVSLNDLSNVDLTGLANNSILKYQSSSGNWIMGSDTDTGIAAVVDDPSPELGGPLDVLTRSIVSSSNRDITLAPDGTGQIALTGGTTNASPVNISFNDDGAAAGPNLILNRTSASPANGDNLGAILFRGKDDAGNTDTYASIGSEIEKKNSGSERGRIDFNVIADGSEETVMTMNRNGLFMAAGNKFALAGSTNNNNFVTLVTATDPTGFRAIGFPDADGTVVLTDTTDTLTNKTLTNPVISQIVSVSGGNIELDPDGTGGIILDAKTDINGIRTQPNTLFINTDMQADTVTDDLHNSIQCNLDYSGSTIGSGTRQNSITFGFTDDTIGDEQAGRFSCEFTSADTTSNKMKLIAIDNSTSGAVNGQIDVSPKKGTINVPFELPTYAVGSLPTTGIGAGAIAYATGLNSSDVSTGKAMVFYDGSNWKYMHIPQTTARS
tara:strand:- start:123 stop:1502 length:1380 start_codon:yes stop_codon:yes gene_type:complete